MSVGSACAWAVVFICVNLITCALYAWAIRGWLYWLILFSLGTSTIHSGREEEEEDENKKQFHQTVCVKMKKKEEYNEEYCAISHYVEETEDEEEIKKRWKKERLNN